MPKLIILRKTQSSVVRRNSLARALYVLNVDSDTPGCLFNKIRLDFSYWSFSFFLDNIPSLQGKSSVGFMQEGEFHKRALA